MPERKLTIDVEIKKRTTSQGKNVDDKKSDVESQKQADKEKLESLKASLKQKQSLLDADIKRQQALLDNAKRMELEAERQGNREKIKEMIAYRKLMESQLRVMEADMRLLRSKDLAEFKTNLKEKERVQKQYDREIRNAPRTKFAGDIGSLAYTQQIARKQSGMLPGTTEFTQSGVLVDNYKNKLSALGVDVRSLSEKIGGELKTSLAGASASFIQTTAAGLGLTLGLQQLITFTTKAINEFAKEEASMRVLEASVTKITGQNVSLANSLEEYSQQLQSNYNINDDAIRQQLAFLVIQGRTEQQIKEITNAAIDLSAAQGDLSDENVIANISKLDATYEEVLGKLAKYDSRLKDLTPEQLRNGEAVRLLGSKYKGMADEIDKGSLESTRSVKILWNTFLEFAGSVFAREGALLKGLTTLNKNLREGQGVWYSYIVAMKEAAGTLPLIGGEMSALIGIMQNLLGVTGQLQTAIRDIKPPDLNLKSIRKDFSGNYEDAIRSLVNAYGLSWEQAKQMIDAEFPSAKEKEAENSNRGRTNTSGKTKKDKEDELNLIKLQEKELTKLQKQLQANLGDIGAELDLRTKIRDVEREIKRLREGEPFTAITPKIPGQSGIVAYQGVGITRRDGNYGRDAGIDQAQRIQEIYNQIDEKQLSAFNQSLSIVQQIDQALGGGAADVIQGFQTAYSITQSIVELLNTLNDISNLFSLIPGVGGAIGAIARAEGGTVDAGKLYEWNENGKELFIPTTSGYVLDAKRFNEFSNSVSAMASVMDRDRNYVNSIVRNPGSQNIIVKNFINNPIDFKQAFKVTQTEVELADNNSNS